MELAPAVIGFVGVVIGSVIVHILSARREANARRFAVDLAELQLRREKVEELYSLVSKWELTMSSTSITWMMCMQGKFSYNDALDLMTKNSPKESEFFRIEMLIDAYIMRVRATFDLLMDDRAKVNAILRDFKDFYESFGEGSVFPGLNDHTAASRQLEAHSQVLKEELVGELRQLTPKTLNNSSKPEIASATSPSA